MNLSWRPWRLGGFLFGCGFAALCLVALLIVACPARKAPSPALDAGLVVARPANGEKSIDADAIIARLGGTLPAAERRSLLRRLTAVDRARAVPLLVLAAKDESPEVRLGVARIIGQSRVKEAGAALAGRLRVEPVPIVIAEVSTALALLRDHDVARGLVDLIDSPDADRRTGAARVVGVTLGSGAVSAASLARLVATLSAPDAAVRRDAARVLKELRDARARDPLSHRLSVEKDDMTIAVILNALAAIGDRAAVLPITKFIASLRTRGAIPPYHFVWQRAFAAVTSLGGDDADRFLRDAALWPEVRMTKELVEKLKPWAKGAR